MELTVKQEHLAKAFNIISKIASNRTSLPILSNILLRTSGSRLLIAATDLEIAISQNIGANVVSIDPLSDDWKNNLIFVTKQIANSYK